MQLQKSKDKRNGRTSG